MNQRPVSRFNHSSLDRQILTIAGPAIGGYLALILFDVANMYWISRLGTSAIAAVASSGFLVWTMASLMQITLSGCTSLVAQAYGGERHEEAHRIVVESAWFSLALAFVFIAVFLGLGDRPLVWMGIDQATLAFASRYFFVLLIGFPVTYLFTLAGIVFNAYGRTSATTLTLAISLGANMVLDPVLIFGYCGMPALGIRGAAVATIVSQSVGLLLRLHLLRKDGFIGPYTMFLSPSGKFVVHLARIGLPNALTQGAWSMVYPILSTLITPFGMAPLSAVGICFRLESFPYFGSLGMGVAMSSLIGQAVGRGDEAVVSRIATRGLLWVSLLVFPFALLFILVPGYLLGFFTTDAATLVHGRAYLLAVGTFEIFMGWELLFGGVFTGLGKTWPTLLIGVPFTLGRIPLAWLLAYRLGFGAAGIWWAISISTLA
jgi:putative MATE family efflux protein